MDSFTDYLHRRYDDAVETAGEARARLEYLMNEGETGLAAAMAEVCHREAQSRSCGPDLPSSAFVVPSVRA